MHKSQSDSSLNVTPVVMTAKVRILMFSLVALIYPVCNILLLCRLPTFNYFFGTTSVIFMLGLAVWFAATFVILSRDWVERRIAVLLFLIFPILLLLLSLEGLQMRFQSLLLSLHSEDCVSFEEKADIETAWWYAHDLLVNCSSSHLRFSTAPLEEVYKSTPIVSCPEYDEAFLKYGGKWTFLSQMEAKYHCGGWCSPEAPIWGTTSSIQDGCAKVAGTALIGTVRSAIVKVVVYLVVLLLFFFGMLSYFPNSVLVA